jgi:hypothetical protein
MSDKELMANLIRQRDELLAQGTRATIVGDRLAVGRNAIRRAVRDLGRYQNRRATRQERTAEQARLEAARLERYEAQREAREAAMAPAKVARILAHQEARRQRRTAFRARLAAAGPQGIGKAVKAGRMASTRMANR